MRCFPVKGITHSIQIAQATKGIGHLKQGATNIVAQPSKQFIGRRIEVDDLTASPKMPTVGWAQDRPSPGRQYTLLTLRQIIKNRFLNIAKASFAFALKILTD